VAARHLPSRRLLLPPAVHLRPEQARYVQSDDLQRRVARPEEAVPQTGDAPSGPPPLQFRGCFSYLYLHMRLRLRLPSLLISAAGRVDLRHGGREPGVLLVAEQSAVLPTAQPRLQSLRISHTARALGLRAGGTTRIHGIVRNIRGI
jgi:hypothetical protein